MTRKSFLFTLIALLTLMLGVAGAIAQAPQQAGNGGCVAGDSYDPACDVNRDGDMNVVDLGLVANHWGQAGIWTSDGVDPANVIVVAKSGGDFASIQAALDSIADAAADNRYLVWVAPGVYSESVVMKQYVDIEGAGELVTKITSTAGGPFADTGTVEGVDNAELRFLTVENTGGNAYAIAIFNNNASPRFTHVTAIASGGTRSWGVHNELSSPTMTNVTASAWGGSTVNGGVRNSNSSSPTMTDVTASASGGDLNNGVENIDSSPTMTDVTATASGGSWNYGVLNSNLSLPTMTNVTAFAWGGSLVNNGVYNINSSPTMTDVAATASGGNLSVNSGVLNKDSSWPMMANVTASAWGGDASYGVYNYSSSPTIHNSTLSANAGANNYGIYNWATAGAYIVRVNNSQITGSTNTIRNDAEFTTRVGASLLDGGPLLNLGGTVTCAGVYDENNVFFNDTCSGDVDPANLIVVAKSGGDFASIQAALDSIADAAADNRYLVWVAPGVYSESVVMKQYVDIEGAGELVTKITSTAGGPNADAGTVEGVDNAELRFLTVENTGGNTFAIAIFNKNASPRLTHVTATTSGGTNSYGVYNELSSPTMTDVTATASGGTNNRGVSNNSSWPTMTNVTATASGGSTNSGVYNESSSPTMTNVTASALGGTNSYGVFNWDSWPTMTNVTASASGGSTSNRGVSNQNNSSPTMTDVTATASGVDLHPNSLNSGVYNWDSSPTMTNVTASASWGLEIYGVYNNSSSPTMRDVTASALGGGINYGVYNNSSSPTMTNVTASASMGNRHIGVYNSNLSSPTMTFVTASASGGPDSYGVYNLDNSSPTMTNVAATASGEDLSFGVYNNNSSSPTMTDVTASASSGGDLNFGVYNLDNSSPTMTDVTATASGGNLSLNYGVRNEDSSSPTMANVTATASGGLESSGVYNYSSSPTIHNSTLSASGGANNYGIYNTATAGAYTVRVNNSQITGSTNTIRNDAEFTTRVGASLLDGGAVAPFGGTVTCAGVYDEHYDFLVNLCIPEPVN